jgi:hypothetical protein
MDIRPFEPSDVADAAQLLARRGNRFLDAFPALEPRLRDPWYCAETLMRAIADGARGAVAVDGPVIAYLLATPEDEDLRGRNEWVTPECHAGGAEALRRLYAHLAAEWVSEGRGHHYVQVRGDDTGESELWAHLSFAVESVHALRPIDDIPEAGSAGATIRRAGIPDIDAIEPLFDVIAEAHSASPVFSFIDESFYANLRPGHAELLEDPSVGYFIAEDGDRVLAYAAFYPVGDDHATYFRPVGSVELIVAASLTEARGRGLMRALVCRGLAWSKEQGFGLCITDWRAANLDSSRAWPAMGFTPIGYRMHRTIDPRLL